MSDNRPVLYGPNGQALPSGIGRAIAMLSAGNAPVDAGRRAGSVAPADLAGWIPAQLSADGGWLWSRDLAVARTRDLIDNDPLAQTARDRKTTLVVGGGWRPSIKPDAAMLGIEPAVAADLGKQMERAFALWGNDILCRCDAQEELTWGGMLAMTSDEHESSGDGLIAMRFIERDDGWRFRTALDVIDSDRLSQPWGAMQTPTFRGGVELGDRGQPIAYHIRNGHPGEFGIATNGEAFSWERIERRTPWGRPQVLHWKRKHRPGQTRGVSKLVACLRGFKNLSRLNDAELQSAVINALNAATITSTMDPALMAEHMTDSGIGNYHQLRNTFYQMLDLRWAGSAVQHLFPGDSLEHLVNARTTANYGVFVDNFVNWFGAAVGITGHMLKMDWKGVNYSQMRGELLEIWRNVERDRMIGAVCVANPVLLAVIEDAIDNGLVVPPAGVPDLYEMPWAWLRCTWLGPPRGWVDPVKEPAGALLEIESGLNDWETAAAGQGRDFDLVLAALIEQRKRWQDAGMTPPALANMIAAAQQLAPDTPEPAQSAA